MIKDVIMREIGGKGRRVQIKLKAADKAGSRGSDIPTLAWWSSS